MKNGTAPAPIPSRRGPVRVEGQDGPWTISVAETPHDTSSYSLYVRTPTHNLTLTRTALEIVEVDGKLRDTLPGIKLPKLPIDASTLPAPPKRKSMFLNTLSRLASPSNKSSGNRQASSSPLANGLNGNGVSAQFMSTNSTVTGLASYLTTVANDSSVRQARAWKRFVRVRTDDLQSVRAERAIKRVRSDLAAHSSPGSTTEIPRSMSQVLGDAENTAASHGERAESLNGTTEAVEDQDSTVEGVPESVAESSVAEDVVVNGDTGDHERDATARDVTESPCSADELESEEPHTESKPPITDSVENDEDIDGRSTPVPAEATASRRMPRSQSAEPTSRISRIFSSPMSSTLRGQPSQTSMTGDDSSISTTGRRSARKKRSKSTDPNAGSGKKSQRKVVIDDFEMMRVLGKGCAGKVLLVRHKTTLDVFALKAITKRHVLAHQELQHTLTEQAVLKRMAAENTDPFVVKLWWSFHDKENLFLVMDFHPGGDLATQLARWGRLGRDRARFYAAEIVEGVEGLHAAGVIYRDLKPENILIGADGHIVLTDFGLSKEFPRRTSAITAPPTPSGSRTEFLDGPIAVPHWMKGEKPQDLANPWTGGNDSTSTFCGTAEYLAPEVIQGLPYSYEVDWWSFVLIYTLFRQTPFWANNHSDMYYRVLQDELQFPEDRTMDQDTKSLVRGLLQRNPALRMKEPRIKKHPYFSMIDWSHVYHKRYIPPYIPPIDPSNASDTQNFDDTFLDMEPVINDDNDNDQTDTDQQTDTDRTDGEDSVATPSQSRSPSVHPADDDSVDLFDGYSFKGRHSVILDEDEDADGDESEEDGPDMDDRSSLAAAELDSLLQEDSILEADAVSTNEMATVHEVPEPATPEARPTILPDNVEPLVADVETPVETRTTELHHAPEPPSEVIEPVHEEIAPEPVSVAVLPVTMPKPETIVVKAPVPRAVGKLRTGRREKSGIHAFDRNLGDVADEEPATERDDEDDDDDWDFVETNVNEERNGAKGTSLFARGVVDRYKLSVFRKSTPRRSNGRTVSGLSTESDLLASPEQSNSPTPDKFRRGRNPGLTFRRNPKEFLRPKSPSRTTSSKSLTHSTSATLSTSSAGRLTSSPSLSSTLPVTPSLKSKESAVSVGSPSESSDQSINGDQRPPASNMARATSVVSSEEKQKSKGLKKYKEGAEKVLSIFQSPR
ncbi:hypothetical protein EW026_g1445 [Hermanssonia centrifuga]|uniref:non-specific serine/threonine protein kinase n=1 Tax=Hermanssonia centrifuga TaxID=98765 RepID=A0A4S4KRH2_9APHY|nr:hypothetical protein EW026_g1445 [Hermanssonia centrifuga]